MTEEPKKILAISEKQLELLTEKAATANHRFYVSKIMIWRILAIYCLIITFFDIILEPGYYGSLQIGLSLLFLSLSLSSEIVYRTLRKKGSYVNFLEGSKKDVSDSFFESQVKSEIDEIIGDVEDG